MHPDPVDNLLAVLRDDMEAIVDQRDVRTVLTDLGRVRLPYVDCDRLQGPAAWRAQGRQKAAQGFPIAPARDDAFAVEIEHDRCVLLPRPDREFVDRDPPDSLQMIRRRAQLGG